MPTYRGNNYLLNKIFPGQDKPVVDTSAHQTTYYVANPARVKEGDCTICGEGKPEIITYERYHNGVERTEALCPECATPTLLQRLGLRSRERE